MDVWFAILKLLPAVLVSMQVRGAVKIMFPDYCARILETDRRSTGYFSNWALRKREFHWALVADGEHVSMLCGDEHSAQLMETVRNALQKCCKAFSGIEAIVSLFLEHDTCV